MSNAGDEICCCISIILLLKMILVIQGNYRFTQFIIKKACFYSSQVTCLSSAFWKRTQSSKKEHRNQFVVFLLPLPPQWTQHTQNWISLHETQLCCCKISLYILMILFALCKRMDISSILDILITHSKAMHNIVITEKSIVNQLKI